MNDVYARNMLKKLQKWLDRREVFAIKGPRQSGKTTLMLMLREKLLQSGVPDKNIVFLSCDDFDAVEPFVKDPKAFVKSYVRTGERHYFFLDEYQYVPEGGRRLKVLYDAFPNVKFVISGSSSLELKDKTAKYLVGRVFYFTLYPFSFGEFVSAVSERLGGVYEQRNSAIIDFVLKNKSLSVKNDIFLTEISKLFEDYVVFGGYPEVVKAHDVETKKTILKNVYDTYISKDIVELLKITDTLKFRNIVSFLAAMHSGLLNIESVASDSKSNYREVKRFLSVLEETYILNILTPFHKNISTELKKNPKLYFLDAGMRNYVVKNFNPPVFRDDRGKLAEGFVLTELLGLLQDMAEIRYWRTLAKAEVDFVVLAGNEAVPVDVKYESFKKPKIERSLRSFIQQYKPKRALVITKEYWGSMKLNGTEIKFVPICYL